MKKIWRAERKKGEIHMYIYLNEGIKSILSIVLDTASNAI